MSDRQCYNCGPATPSADDERWLCPKCAVHYEFADNGRMQVKRHGAQEPLSTEEQIAHIAKIKFSQEDLFAAGSPVTVSHKRLAEIYRALGVADHEAAMWRIKELLAFGRPRT